MLDIFKRTMPFQVVADGMLRKIAALSWRVTFAPGAVVYDAGDKADDIYIVVSGSRAFNRYMTLPISVRLVSRSSPRASLV